MDERLIVRECRRPGSLHAARDPRLPGTTTTTSPAWSRSGIWRRVRTGAFIAASTWERLDEVDRHRVRSPRRTPQGQVRGRACRTCSALAEYGAPFWDLLARRRAPDPVRPARRSLARPASVSTVGDCSWATSRSRNEVMVTSPVRTALDIMASTDTEHGVVVGSSMLRAGLCTLPQLDACVRRDRAAGALARHLGWCSASWTHASSRSARRGPPSTAGRRGCRGPEPAVRDPRDGQARGEARPCLAGAPCRGSSSTGGASTSTIWRER